jgi:ABC-type nitrate/sulfonate/bicarbonate transport system permease component
VTAGAPGVDRGLRAAGRSSRLPLHGVTALTSPAASLLTMVALWYVLIAAAHGNALVTKDPLDVVRYLVGGPGAGAHRGTMGRTLLTTLAHAGLGYAAGTVLATAVACVFVLFRAVERTFMPLVMVIRTTPIVAMAPLLTLLFGRGLLAVTVITALIVAFPSLVNLLFGLRSAQPEALDLLEAYGASRLTTLRKVRLPGAVPAFFAAARIAVPGAIIGALVSEWLATGNGLGYQMLISTTTFDYAGLWTSVVVVTLVSIAVYELVGGVEAIVERRMTQAGAAVGQTDLEPRSSG